MHNNPVRLFVLLLLLLLLVLLLFFMRLCRLMEDLQMVNQCGAKYCVS
jgi:hypothetical protein